MSDAPVTLFIPFGTGYGNPGLTLRAETVKELNATMLDLKELGDEGLSLLDSLLSEVETIKAAVLLKFPQEDKPAPRPSNSVATVTPPAGSVKSCDHGPMKYKEGVSKANKPYKAWFCPAPQGTNQCKPEFIN
jgi:hypothetical protein